MTRGPISFENVTHHGHVAIPDGFKGLDWSHIQAVDDSQAEAWSLPGQKNGFLNVLQTGDAVALACKNDNVSDIKSDVSFSLKGGWFASAWLNGMTVTFTAQRHGVEVGHVTTTLGIDAKFLTFGHDFRNIDDLRIETSGGTDAFPGDGDDHSLAMDDLTFVSIKHATHTPDPPDVHHWLVHGHVPDHHVFLV